MARYCSPSSGMPSKSSGSVPTGSLACPASAASRSVRCMLRRRKLCGSPLLMTVHDPGCSADVNFSSSGRTQWSILGFRRSWARAIEAGAPRSPSTLKCHWQGTLRVQVRAATTSWVRHSHNAEKRVRDRAIRSLTAYLLQCSDTDGLQMSSVELAKLWKGIFYCSSYGADATVLTTQASGCPTSR